jgi:hypothetical protein
MLAELCYNFSEYYKAVRLAKSSAKAKPQPIKKHHSSKTKHTSGARTATRRKSDK